VPSAAKSVAGEGRTLDDLYDRFGTLAYSLAFSITGQRETAERIVTDAFATTWQSRRHDTSPNAFFAALMTTVRVSALASRPGLQLRRGAVPTTSRANGTSAGLSSDPTESAVAVALSGLPDAQRRVLMLAYFDGLAVGEIASELHEPMEHVKANLQAALRHLRSVLSEHASSAGFV
jgi:RNA polymerase sigma factor (sigma-70 family)